MADNQHGFISKRIAAANLPCAKCAHFRDDDPDIFYCHLDCREFPALCNEYRYRGLDYQVLDEDDGELD